MVKCAVTTIDWKTVEKVNMIDVQFNTKVKKLWKADTNLIFFTNYVEK